MLNVEKLARRNVLRMKAYASARSEKELDDSIFLDANENPYSEFGRYPDPFQRKLKDKMAELKQLKTEQVFFGNGSDEIIDLLIRVFCEPDKDNVVTVEPGYGMYKVAADLNDVFVRSAVLNDKFQLSAQNVLDKVDTNTKLIFIGNPNNPTGNAFDRNEILKIVQQVNALVIIDEAYIDFCPEKSLVTELRNYNNMFVVQTLSKAYGLAALRLGIGMGNPKIVELLNKIKPPYNVNSLTQNIALEKLQDTSQVRSWVNEIRNERDALRTFLKDLSFVYKVYPSDANFLLVTVKNASRLVAFLKGENIVIRNRSTMPNCENAVRISIGTIEENERLKIALKIFDSQQVAKYESSMAKE